MRTYTHSPTLRIGYMLALKKWNIAYMRYVTYMYVPRFLLRPALMRGWHLQILPITYFVKLWFERWMYADGGRVCAVSNYTWVLH